MTRLYNVISDFVSLIFPSDVYDFMITSGSGEEYYLSDIFHHLITVVLFLFVLYLLFKFTVKLFRGLTNK